MIITKKDFLKMQPGFPDEAATDAFYFNITTEIANAVSNSSFTKHYGEDIAKEVVLGVMGYYQDIIADAGIWRSFSTICQEMYGKQLPIYDIPEDYIDSELNYVDIRFLCWYILECSAEENGNISPYQEEISEIARIIYDILDKYYDEAPTPVDYNMIADVDIYDPAQIEQVYDLSYWLFWNSYFMKYAATPTLLDNLEKGKKIISEYPHPEDAEPLLRELTQETMKDNPTGPLSLYIHEWLKAIVDNKSPFSKKKTTLADPHKFYTQFIKANDGKILQFCPTYSNLETFLTKMWGQNEGGHFPHLSNMANFVLYASPEKGLLIAPEVGQFVNHPDNKAYNPTVAKAEAHTLLSIQGRCPIDLLKHLFSNGFITDATFPWNAPNNYISENWDFLARLYQQSYYRAK